MREVVVVLGKGKDRNSYRVRTVGGKSTFIVHTDKQLVKDSTILLMNRNVVGTLGEDYIETVKV